MVEPPFFLFPYLFSSAKSEARNFAIPRMSSGVVRQQPPMSEAPLFCHFST